MADVIKIKNTLLNAGAYVTLGVTVFKPGYKRNVQVHPVTGQNTDNTSDGDLDIVESDEISIENGVFSIRGVIDVEEFADNAALHAVTSITDLTLGYLKQLWRVYPSSETVLQIWFGLSNDFSWKNYNGTSDDIKVSIKSIDVQPQGDGNHILQYSINMVEIK